MTRRVDAGVCCRPNCDREELNYGYCKHHKTLNMACGYIDAALFYDRVDLLRARGHSLRSLVHITGISRPTLSRRPIKQVRAETVRRLFSAPVPELWADSTGFVAAVGTRRRIRALRALGYSRANIGAGLGVTKQAVTQWTSCEGFVAAATANKVDVLFRLWQMTVGPSSRARAHAERQGWAPPLAYDNIDDPSEQPASSVEASVTWLDRYQELRDLGVPESRIPERMGIDRKSVERHLMRLGLFKGAA